MAQWLALYPNHKGIYAKSGYTLNAQQHVRYLRHTDLHLSNNSRHFRRQKPDRLKDPCSVKNTKKNRQNRA